MSNLLSDIETKFPYLIANLKHSANNHRIAQSYLLVGDDGQLLFEMALGLAQMVNCSNLDFQKGACGICENCIHLAKQTYSELKIVCPQSKSRTILIDQLVELMDSLSMTVSQGKKKVGIIIDAETMNTTAQNAFLKTLEEPDDHTLLILCTTRPRLLLPTIKSRCRILSLRNNQKNYSLFVEKGLFQALMLLKPNCKLENALEQARVIKTILASLVQDAENFDSRSDEMRKKWAETEVSLVMKKQLKSQEEAEQKSEYLKLREGFISAVQTWYNQIELLVYGISLKKIPCPEILPNDFDSNQLPSVDSLIFIRNAVEKLSLCLSTNANEGLAIEAFCLEIATIKI